MKACVLRKPAPIEDRPLDYTDVPTPDPGPGRVLVRVKVHVITRDEDGRNFLAEAAGIPVGTHVEAFPLEDANRALYTLKSKAIAGCGVRVVEE